MNSSRVLFAGLAFATATVVSTTGMASTLWVGNDTGGPVSRYTTGGVFLGDFGGGGATGTALDGAYAYTVAPSFPDSVITKYNASQTPVGVTHFTNGIPTGDSWIEDMATGAGHTLWLSGFDGEIYHIDTAGTVLSSFDSGHQFTGIEVVGGSVYTTGGFDNGNIYQYDLAGNLISTISTSLSEIGGLAYDPTDNTFWGGDFIVVNHISATGVLLGSITAGGAFHDGLALGDLTGGVPEPAAWALMLVGFGAVGAMVRGSRGKSGSALRAG